MSLTDFETSQEVFVKQGKKCYNRQLAPILEHVTGKGLRIALKVGKCSEKYKKSKTISSNFSGGVGLLTANGENWAEMRRFTLR